MEKDKTSVESTDKTKFNGERTQSRNGKGKPKRGDKTSRNSKFTNNLDWWNRYPVLTKDVTNIAFNWIPGMQLQLSDCLAGGTNLDVPIAGVMVLKYLPTIGNCDTDSDSYNAQMRELYIDMHRKYRGLATYQKSDLGIALFCITDLFSTIAWAERIYGVVNHYNIQNRNVPYNIMEGLHIGPTITGNLSNYRYQLNLRIMRAQQLCLPRGLTMLESRIIMNSAVFKDSENPRAALFMYEPSVYYTFDATSVSTGSAAVATLLDQSMSGTTAGGNPAFVMGAIFNIIDAQLNALLNDDDVTKMCSDLIAAYGPENVTTLLPVPDDYQVVPVHDDERKLQMHNATLCGEITGRYLNAVINTTAAQAFLNNYHPVVIYQHDNIIKNDLSVGKYTGTYVNHSQINEVEILTPIKAQNCVFDVWRDKPTDADILCGTRFTVLGDPAVKNGSNYYQRLNAFGFDIVQDLTIYTKYGSTVTVDNIGHSYVQSGDLAEVEFCDLIKFDWHPIIYIEDTTNLLLFGDLDNLTILKAYDLQQLHTVAVLSGSKLPMIGSTQVDTKQ